VGFVPQKRKPERQSPLPEEWSEGAKPLRDAIRALERMFDEN